MKLSTGRDYDNVENALKPITLAEFAEYAKATIDEYVAALDQKNEWTKGAHTFVEWMGNFWRWASW